VPTLARPVTRAECFEFAELGVFEVSRGRVRAFCESSGILVTGGRDGSQRPEDGCRDGVDEPV